MTELVRPPLVARHQLAERIEERTVEVAEAVTVEFLRRHPDWLERYGAERAHAWGVRDATFHLGHLAGAVVIDSPSAFADYGRWVASMLAARGIAPEHLQENLEQVVAAFTGDVAAEHRPWLACFAEIDVSGAASPDVPGEPALAAAQRVFLQAALRGDRAAARGIVLDAAARYELVDLYVDVFERSLVEVGRRWAAAELTVEEEHLATAVIQASLSAVYDQLPPANARSGERPRTVLAGMRGELHQLGMNIVADALEADGWDVRFLGADVATADLLAAVEVHRPHVVGIGATIVANLPQAMHAVRALQEQFGEQGPALLLGGRAWRHAHPDAVPGAELAAGVRDTLAAAERLLATVPPLSSRADLRRGPAQ